MADRFKRDVDTGNGIDVADGFERNIEMKWCRCNRQHTAFRTLENANPAKTRLKFSKSPFEDNHPKIHPVVSYNVTRTLRANLVPLAIPHSLHWSIRTPCALSSTPQALPNPGIQRSSEREMAPFSTLLFFVPHHVGTHASRYDPISYSFENIRPRTERRCPPKHRLVGVT